MTTLELADSVVHTLTYGVSGGILLNVVDDAFVDARYILGGLGRRDRRIVSEATLRAAPERRIAIMLPAWKEAEVIEAMLEHNVTSIDFPRDRFDIFCGTYQNDPETQAAVDAAARRFPNIHKVVVPHDGPTSKADCLNWVYQGIILEEKKRGERFEILLMQDAEDLVHPLALRLYSLLIPAHDFVQTPVFSVPLPKSRLVSATYIDEFAEHHLKDMLVREAIGGLVPSAGVGSGFDRDAFEEIATAQGQHPFNVDSLTEDYEIGLKFRLANKKTHFACNAIERFDPVTGARSEELIATRELFPGGLSASIRQRSRWILGITLQTWAQIGWQGAAAVLYCLWRDRKALFTNALLCAAYSLLFYVGLRKVLGVTLGTPWHLDAIVPAGSPLSWMLAFNLGFAAWRVLVKAHFVGRLYGAGHAVLSFPRMVLANFIGVLATSRAVVQYVGHRLSGRPLRWLKTAHEFPTFERLAQRWRRLGEMLLEHAAITSAQLEEALRLQRETGARLGEVLALSGLASARDIAAAVGAQHGLDAGEPSIRVSRALLRELPEPIAEDLDVMPIEEQDGAVVVAAAEPLDAAAISRLEKVFGRRVTARIASRSAIRHARERAYRRLLCERSLVRPAAAPRTTNPDLADRQLVSRLGVAFCSFHRVLPLRTRPGIPPRILTPAPLHPTVQAEIERRLKARITVELTSPLALRVRLAAVEGSIPTPANGLGLSGVDAIEWLALTREIGNTNDSTSSSALAAVEPQPGALLGRIVRDGRAEGCSPLESIEKLGATDPVTIARARARAFGLDVAPRGASTVGVLPARIVLAHDVTLVARDDESLHLAAPRPTPRLAQEVAALLEPRRVAWSVALPAEIH